MNPNPKKVVTGVVRGTFLNLFTPRAGQDGGKPKYSMRILIPKTDSDTLTAMKNARQAAIHEEWPNKVPAKIHSTLHDGDGVRESGEEFGPECKGHYVMTVSALFPPHIVDQRMNAIVDPNAVKNGDYFRVSLNAYTYDTAGKKGVSFGLQNVQLYKLGEPLGGERSRPEDDFTPVEVEDEFVSQEEDDDSLPF